MGKLNCFDHLVLQGCFIWYLQFSSNFAGLFSCNKQGKLNSIFFSVKHQLITAQQKKKPLKASS